MVRLKIMPAVRSAQAVAVPASRRREAVLAAGVQKPPRKPVLPVCFARNDEGAV